jgi:hypothetical protein
MFDFFKKQKILFYMAFLIILHLYLTLLLLPLDQLRNEHPIFDIDYPVNFYKALRMRWMLSESAAAWGYDPYSMAGYPGGTVDDVDNKSVGLVVWVFSFLGPARAFKLYVFFIYLWIPASLYLSARNFQLTRFEAAISSTLALLCWYFFIGEPPLRAGTFSFTFASYLSLFSFSLFYRFLKTNKARNFIAFFLVSAWNFCVHAMSILILGPALVLAYLCALKKMPKKTHLLLLLWAGWILLTNSFWIFPLLRFLELKTSTKTYMQTQGLFFMVYNPVGRFLLPFGLLGLIFWRKKEDLLKAATFFIMWLYLAIVSAYGSRLPIFDQLEPLRFVGPLVFFSIIPASKLTSSVLSRLLRAALDLKNKVGFLRNLGDNFFKIPLVSFGMVLLFMYILVLYAQNIDLSYKIKRGEILDATLPPHGWAMIEWIKENTAREGRILIEDAGEKWGGQKYFGGHLPALLPWYVKREFIGGPEPDYFIKHHFASFINGKLFQRDITDFSASLLQTYFDAYNIKWIIAWSDKSKAYFKRHASYIIYLHTIGEFSFYEVNRDPSFFLQGSGKLSADYNKIFVTEASAGEIVIKYHWLSTLKTRPPLKIERCQILDDPIGFIRIYNGEIREFEIYNAY